VLANPPYSIKQWNREAFAADPWGRNVFGVPPQGRADYAFQQHILQSLKPKSGRCAVLWPHGILFRNEEDDIRRKLIESDYIEAVIGLGPNLFYNSSMQSCIVICRTNKAPKQKRKILFIDAVNEVTRERTQSFLTRAHIDRIVQALRTFNTEEGFAKAATIEEIKANQWSLNIPLYVQTAATKTLVQKDTGNTSVDSELAAWLNSRSEVRDALASVLPKISEPHSTEKLKADAVTALARFDRTKWKKATLGDVCDEISVRIDNPASLGHARFVGLEHFDSGDLKIRRWGTTESLESAMKVFSSGDVLFARRNAYLKRASLADFDGVCSGDAIVLRERHETIVPGFLAFLLNTNRFWEFAIANAAGTMSRRVNGKTLMRFEFDLPPLDQQRRIGEILWAVDEASEAQLKLRSDLTEHLQALRRSLYSGNKCKMVQVRDVGDKTRQVVQVGPFGGSLCSRHFVSDGVPVVKVNNITGDNQIDLTGAVFVSKAHASSLSRYEVRAGDILIAAQGDTTGRSGLAGAESDGAIISQHLARVAVDSQLCRPQFLAEIFRADELQRQVDAVKMKTTRPGLNTDDVEAFSIPLPGLDEQDRFCEATHSSAKCIKACTEAVASGKDLCRALIGVFTTL
jgi:type I restriction enzyme M protein